MKEPIEEQKEVIKVRMTTKINVEEDLKRLEVYDHNLHIDEIEFLTSQFLSNINLKHDQRSLKFFAGTFLKECSGNYLDKIDIIKAFNDFEVFDYNKFFKQNGLGSFSKYVKNKYITPRALHSLINYKADDISTSGVGRGEFALALFLPGSNKSSSHADIVFRDKFIEIKGFNAGLYNQSSHNSPITIGKKLKEFLGNRELKSFCKKHLEEYYPQILTRNEYIQFLKIGLSNLPHHDICKEYYDYIDECVSKNNVFNYDHYIDQQSNIEFDYYKNYCKLDNIIFIDADTLLFLNIADRHAFNDNHHHLKITSAFNWNFDKVRTLQYRINTKPKIINIL